MCTPEVCQVGTAGVVRSSRRMVAPPDPGGQADGRTPLDSRGRLNHVFSSSCKYMYSGSPSPAHFRKLTTDGYVTDHNLYTSDAYYCLYPMLLDPTVHLMTAHSTPKSLNLMNVHLITTFIA